MLQNSSEINRFLVKLFNGDQWLVDKVKKTAKLKNFKEGDQIIAIGQKASFIPIVVSGAIKIHREDINGEELFLYYLHPEETCALNLQCCNTGKGVIINAYAETDTEIIALPSSYMNEWISENNSWKKFIFNTFSKRFEELLQTIDSIAFQQLDERLWDYLKEKSSINAHKELNISHKEIANDLGSSREVISRLLKQLEKMKKVKLSRSKIQLCDIGH